MAPIRSKPVAASPAADVQALATKLQSGRFQNIVFMVGAGISTAAGIPDFRTPGTGLYSNLARLNLPYPEAVFDIEYFRKRPQAFYTLADELFPSKFKPTKFHWFMRLVQEKGYLRRVFTQNIDTLERLAGVQGDKVVEAHGSFAGNSCIDCKARMDPSELQRQMYHGSTGNTLQKGQKVGIPRCKSPGCNGLVKPDIVFFGEGLPARFFNLWEDDLPSADLAIIAGTSLTVSPFAQLPDDVESSCARLLFNMEPVGTLGRRKRDVVVLGGCDDEIEKFVELCGWQREWQELLKGGSEKEEVVGKREEGEKKGKEEKSVVDKLAEKEKEKEKAVEEPEETKEEPKEESKDESKDDLGLADDLSSKLNI